MRIALIHLENFLCPIDFYSSFLYVLLWVSFLRKYFFRFFLIEYTFAWNVLATLLLNCFIEHSGDVNMGQSSATSVWNPYVNWSSVCCVCADILWSLIIISNLLWGIQALIEKNLKYFFSPPSSLSFWIGIFKTFLFVNLGCNLACTSWDCFCDSCLNQDKWLRQGRCLYFE